MKNFKIAVSVVLILMTLSGCMNTVHLKDLLIVEALGIDCSDELNVSVQFLNPGQAANGEAPAGNMTMNTQSAGDSIVDSVSALSKKFSKQIFFGQNKLVVFGKDLCRTEFKKNLDYFLRSSDSRADVAICMSAVDAKSIIESKENDVSVPAENIVSLINNGEESGKSIYVNANELLNVYIDKTSDVYLPVVNKKEKDDSVSLEGIGIFDDDSLSYVLNDDESMGFAILNNKIKASFLEINDEILGEIGIKLNSVKSKNLVEVRNGDIIMSSTVKADITLDEIEKGIVTSLKEEDLTRLCALVQNKLEDLCEKAFYACRNHNSDALRVGDMLAKDSPANYEIVKDNWKSYYKNVQYSVSSTAQLKKISDNTRLE